MERKKKEREEKAFRDAYRYATYPHPFALVVHSSMENGVQDLACSALPELALSDASMILCCVGTHVWRSSCRRSQRRRARSTSHLCDQCCALCLSWTRQYSLGLVTPTCYTTHKYTHHPPSPSPSPSPSPFPFPFPSRTVQKLQLFFCFSGDFPEQVSAICQVCVACLIYLSFLGVVRNSPFRNQSSAGVIYA